ncbi:MAG: DUF1549 domain-containing protein [Pirellulales bacterium]
MDRHLILLACLLIGTSYGRAQEGPVAADGAAPLPSASQRFATAEGDEAPDFRRHVLPLLGRVGCNGRACHGSFQGQGDFRLSLFGYDLEADLAALAGGESPRVNKLEPLQSLILQKPTQQIPHEGGQRLQAGTWQFHLLQRWIAAGANGTAADAAGRFERLEVTPGEIMFDRPGEQRQLLVTACWSDGTREDVTALCRFRSNDDSIATIDDDGLVTSLQAGDTHVVSFYDNGVQPVPVLTPFGGQPGQAYPNVPAPTKVDELVVAKLSRLNIVPSELSDDVEFLRRVSLDICGTLPQPQEIEQFSADTSPGKRGAKIDELLARPTYAAWWTTKLCDFVGNSPKVLNEQPFNGDLAARQWYAWLYQRVLQNKPYDDIAAGMILASGRIEGQSYEDYCREMGRHAQDETGQSFAERATMPHFWMRRNNRKPQEKAQSFAYAFMGVRIQCAECHKHPFDQWTKSDFDDFTAFFKTVTFGVSADGRARSKELQEELKEAAKAADGTKANINRLIPQLIAEGKLVPWREVFVAPVKEAKPPKKNKKNKPKKNAEEQPEPPAKIFARFLEGEEVELVPGSDPRQALVDWLRRDAGDYFAKAFVNRVWAGYFHAGIIEPPDDLNRANPPSNQPLLDHLTRGFIDHQFDMKWLHREITNSRTYQLSCQTNDSNRLDSRNFSHAIPRRLPAEVAYNALLQATARSDQLAGFHTDVGDLATGNASGPPNAKGRGRNNYALMVFGQPVRATNCDCERSMEPTLLQTLFLRNDGEMLNLIERSDGWLAQLGGEAKAEELAAQRAELAQQQQTNKQELAELDARLQELATPAEKADPNPATDDKQAAAKRKEAENRKSQAIKRLTKRRAKVERDINKQEAQLARLAPLVAAQPVEPLDTDALIRHCYLRTVSRQPTDAEIDRVTQYMADPANQQTALRDVLWALINTKEFILNH